MKQQQSSLASVLCVDLEGTLIDGDGFALSFLMLLRGNRLRIFPG